MAVRTPPHCDKFMVTSEEIKSIWEWHNQPWLKYFRILTSVKLQTTITDHNILLFILWVTQNSSGLTHISMVKVWSKGRIIGPMPLDLWNWEHSGLWEPKKITDVESYLRRKNSSTYFLIQGFTQSGTVTEWSSKLRRNIFVQISLTVKITLFYAPYLSMLYQEYLLGGKGGRCVGLTSLPTSCADCVHILGASISWRHNDLFRTIQG